MPLVDMLSKDHKDPTDRFFAFAQERHQIYLNRTAGKPWPWTQDKILQTYSFTNVFRELDKTTVWFRQHVRDALRDRPEVMLATVVFRLLNRIEVGEAVFCQLDLDKQQIGKSMFGTKWPVPFELFLRDGDARHLRRAIVANCGKGPYVTGAYIISSPKGYSKLDGMMKIIGDFHKRSGWREFADGMAREECSLAAAQCWLREQPYFGNFHSYEIVTDLRHTALLESAEDVDQWCSVGPGARRGLNRARGRHYKDKSLSTEEMLREMGKLLRMTRVKSAGKWPADWPRLEMREIEHTLCEFDKYERTRTGQGRPRGVYRHG